MSNPIIIAASAAAARSGAPIGSISIVAPLRASTAAVVVRWAGLTSDVDTIDAPPGIEVLSWTTRESTVVSLPVTADLQGLVIGAGWQFGCWDIGRTCLPPDPTQALPPTLAPWHRPMREAGYVAWMMRPMLLGPELRAKAHAADDVTLNPWSFGRDGTPPNLTIPELRPGTATTIRLGRRPQGAGPGNRSGRAYPSRKPRRASINQINYIYALCRRTGEPPGNPLLLSAGEASARIDDLLSRLGDAT